MANGVQKYIDMWKQYVEGIKRGERKMSKNNMLIIFLSGILLYIIFLPTDNNTSYKKDESADVGVQTTVSQGVDTTTMTYQDKLENELEEFLELVDGVGAVEALIYLDTSEKYIVEKDNPTTNSTSEETVEGGGTNYQQELQNEETTVYTVNSNGDEVPFVIQTKNPPVAGIVIAAQGADNETVKLQIIKMTMALYGVEANKIEVLTMRK